MADSQDEDDLFKETSMTFGEHLEELRGALFKAVLALAVGTGIGLIFGFKIVQLIQFPMVSALTTFYTQEAIEYVNARVPEAMKNDPAIRDLVVKEGLQPHEVYLDPRAMYGQLKEKYPAEFEGITLPPATPPKRDPAAKPDEKPSDEPPWITRDHLIRMFEWTPIAEDERLRMETFNPQEGFVIYIKAALLFGAISSSPFAFYFLWSFVAAGLYPHEKKYVQSYLPFSVGLFLAGAALAFLLVFPAVLGFFLEIGKAMDQNMRPRISEWMSFVLLMPLAFGVSFQLPLVMLFLDRIGVFSVTLYVAKWRVAVLVLAVVAMILSPGGDPNSMLLMFVPLVGLYFGGIGLCKYLPKRDRGPGDNAELRETVGAGR